MSGRLRLVLVSVIVGIILVVAIVQSNGDSHSARTAEEPASALGLADLELTTDVPQAVGEGCDEASNIAARDVACLMVVPEGRTVRDFVCRLGGCADESGTGWVADFTTRRLRGTSVHWLFGSGRRRAVCRSLIARDLRAPVKRRSARLAGRRAQLLRIPSFENGGGLHGGHLVVIWSGQRRAWFVSIYGARHAAVREVAAGWMRALGHADQDDDAEAARAVGC